MRLAVTSTRSRNTEFITEDGQLWYTVETPFRLGSRTSTFTRVQPKHEVIGEIIWKHLSQSRVRIGTTVLNRKDFLRRQGTYSSHKLMRGSDGLEYEWKGTNSEPTLWSLSTGRCVASYRYTNILKSQKGVLSIEPEGEGIMDVIIIAFTIIDKTKKENQMAVNSTISGSIAVNSAGG